MKAMILAAGLGTRLKPLTNNKPKALVECAGIPMIERLINNLKNQGFTKIYVNVHHFSNQLINFLTTKDFGADIIISDESDMLLDTGGGIKKAYSLLFSNDNSPVLFHNVDILSNADLKELYINAATGNKSLLLVNDRPTTRKLIFDKNYELRGWHDLSKNIFKPSDFVQDVDYVENAFSGIYVLNEETVKELVTIIKEAKFSIMDYFLNPKRSQLIYGAKQENLNVFDIGKPATLSQASDILKNLYTVLS